MSYEQHTRDFEKLVSIVHTKNILSAFPAMLFGMLSKMWYCLSLPIALSTWILTEAILLVYQFILSRG